MGGRVIRLQLDRTAELALRGRPVPLVVRERQTERGVCLGQIGIETERGSRGGDGESEPINTRRPVAEHVNIGQAGMRACIERITTQRCLEVSER